MAVLVFSVLLASGVNAAEKAHWAAIADEVCEAVGKARTLAKAGKTDDAKGAVTDAYFGVFEEKKMEVAMRSQFGRAHTEDVEEKFNALRKAAGKADMTRVQSLVEAICAAVRKDGAKLDAAKVAADGIGIRK